MENATMKNYYIYRITNKTNSIHYYGSRTTSINPHDDIGVNYFSSSYDKDFLKEQKESPNNFKYKVVKIFKDKDKCLDFECMLHKKFNVSKNKSFYNMQNQRHNGFSTDGKTVGVVLNTMKKEFVDVDDERFKSGEMVPFMKLIERTPEWRQNMSKGKMGYVRTEESKRKQSLSSKGKKKPDGFGDHVSKCLTGVSKSEEHKKKLSESLIGHTIVMDVDGNTFKVKIDDERFLSGELKSAFFSKKTRIVHVYNENDELEYECINQNFQKFLKFHNLPYSFLKPFTNHDQTPIFQDVISKATLSRLKNSGMYKYKGWYVKRIE